MSGFLLTASPTASGFNPLWIVATIAIGTVLVTGGMWIGKIQTKTSSFNTLIAEIRDSLSDIQENTKELLRRLPPKPVAEGSPLQLTDLGREISGQIDAEAWAQERAIELAVRTEGFSAEFEFHAFADEYVRGKEFKPSEGFRRKMDACAYQNGVSTDQVKDVLVVVLRDVLLAKSATET